ncbi:MAG TPA: hypothetical protein VFX57_06340 [Sulfuricurvum sp.]|nr:hypothetical protein [Sulfuricurvum sp.]
MRSGTRNRSFLLAVCALISASALHSDEYWIGYRLTTHNSHLTSEHLTVSKSMTPCGGEKTSLLVLPRQPNESLHSLLKSNEDDFIEYATRQPLKLQSRQNIAHQTHRSTETLTLPTQCYTVDFNDDSVTITLLK